MLPELRTNNISAFEASFAFEKEKLDQLDQKFGPVMQLSLEALQAEALGYLNDCEFKVWKSIDTNKGKLRDPRLDKTGNATALSNHTEIDILQAIVYLERWKAARRSAGSRRAAITRKHNAIKMKQLSELLEETRKPSREQLRAALTIK